MLGEYIRERFQLEIFLSDHLLSYIQTDEQHETVTDSCKNDHLECFH